MRKRNLFDELMEGFDAVEAEREGKGRIKKVRAELADESPVQEESGTLAVPSTSPKEMSCPRRKSPL
ncbi:hypothetical protein GTP46_13385 [Duganella sp. FT135W]|uniref:Uncharacterized protein n=1 Tax=Duganella flavida TaxID=2692175 RepID=A0A6L8KCU2_9BURK|nr:hypothetical protein [Duganella flavida]MYM23642.1 hypothetical protein [Duganella flavida]